jgi:hypothetical protein
MVDGTWDASGIGQPGSPDAGATCVGRQLGSAMKGEYGAAGTWPAQ